MQIGYCSNVHPGRNLEEVQQNLTKFSLAVKQIVSPQKPLGIGIWLSATTAAELKDENRLETFKAWLADNGLLPFTFNGFPFGDFHQPIVKHDVYLPTWADQSRLDYTVDLARIQQRLLPDGMQATISTLPLGWPIKPSLMSDQNLFRECAKNLRQCAFELAEIEQVSGRRILICIEPEPGCLIDTCGDLVDFFENYLLVGNSETESIVRRHIGVCHDICHSAVMFEDQKTAIETYSSAGINVGKIQVSSAIEIDFDQLSGSAKQSALTQLAGFAEPRYLHQTSIQSANGTTFFEDLPAALERFGAVDRVMGKWRVHFHVPIFAKSLGNIQTTQAEIMKCDAALKELNCETQHFEIETYAWNVLPEEWQAKSLSEGIAHEWSWFEHEFCEL